MFTLTINWTQIIVSALPFAILLTIKFLLDLRLASFAVKWFYWLPVRNIFREKPAQIDGDWEHVWQAGGSLSFHEEKSRVGHTTMRQLGSYCYAEFYSNLRRYAFFGSIKGNYIVGEWYDIKDNAGYFGVFQLEIITSSRLNGLWLGHSKVGREIRHDLSQWTKVN